MLLHFSFLILCKHRSASELRASIFDAPQLAKNYTSLKRLLEPPTFYSLPPSALGTLPSAHLRKLQPGYLDF
jgi:hypothetical protein